MSSLPASATRGRQLFGAPPPFRKNWRPSRAALARANVARRLESVLPAPLPHSPSLEPPLRLRPPVPAADAVCCSIELLGYVPHAVHFFGNFISRAASCLGLENTGSLILPNSVQRWNVLKSPFKYKRHQNHFERRLSVRQVSLYHAQTDAIDFLAHYVSTVCPHGMTLKLTRYESADAFATQREMDRVAESVLAAGHVPDVPLHQRRIFNDADFFKSVLAFELQKLSYQIPSVDSAKRPPAFSHSSTQFLGEKNKPTGNPFAARSGGVRDALPAATAGTLTTNKNTLVVAS